jgi:2-methylcitrate dehydratase PrpD
VPTQTLTQQLSELISIPVGDEVRRLASLHLIDWLAASYAASKTDEGRTLISYIRNRPDGPSTALTVGGRDLWSAALLNGGLSIALEADATHRESRLHPGPVTIAAALAKAQHSGASGPSLLDAIVRGYEAMIRLGESTGDQHYAHWHTTTSCGPFGAAAATVSIQLSPDCEQPAGIANPALFAAAFGNAGTLSSGMWQFREEKTKTKLLNAGHAAVTGIIAADLATAGLPGPLQILEGTHGFFEATCPDPDPGAIVRPDSRSWKICSTSIKPWPGCRHIHPAVTAALKLRSMVGDPRVNEIVVVDVGTHRDAVVFADREQPKSRLEAMFSLQHVVATALMTGEQGPGTFEEPTISDPSVADLRKRVHVHEEKRLENRYPVAWGAEVLVRWRDGQTANVSVEHAKGDPEDPLTEDDIETKASALLTSSGFSAAFARRLLDAALILREARDLSQLLEALSTD